MREPALAPIHPGEILREEFLAPLGMSAGGLAKALRVPRTRIERLVREETPDTPDTALRLARTWGPRPASRLSFRRLSPESISPPAPALAVGWMPGTSPGMTKATAPPE